MPSANCSGTCLFLLQLLILITSAQLQQFTSQLFEALIQANSQAFSTNRKYLLEAFTILFQLAPATLYAEALHTTGLFAKFLQILADDKVRV